jgi:soluble lytic murein transglycosylase-like protein
VVNGATDGSVAQAWSGMEAARSSEDAARESVIQQKLEQYAAYDLSRDMAEQIYDTAMHNDLDPDVAFGLVRTESSFKNSATSNVGALGLTQLMSSTARWLEPGTTKSDLRDPETNLRIGFKYLRQLIDRYDGNTRMALLAYNRGPGTVDRVLKRGGDPDNGYASMVLDR